MAKYVSFNSSVGILVVRTMFFLVIARIPLSVSIPRSEFWSFGHGAFVAGGGDVGIVSIPRSEFWSFGPFLFVHIESNSKWFQFLGRNSGRSDDVRGTQLDGGGLLFQFLGRNSGRSDPACS